MTSVNMPRDDAATKITSKSTERTVNPVDPYSKTQPVTAHEGVTQAPPPKVRHHEERRGRNRRQKDAPVILDTRDNHDRRNAAAQEKIDTEDGNPSSKKTGVDDYA